MLQSVRCVFSDFDDKDVFGKEKDAHVAETGGVVEEHDVAENDFSGFGAVGVGQFAFDSLEESVASC